MMILLPTGNPTLLSRLESYYILYSTIYLPAVLRPVVYQSLVYLVQKISPASHRLGLRSYLIQGIPGEVYRRRIHFTYRALCSIYGFWNDRSSKEKRQQKADGSTCYKWAAKQFASVEFILDTPMCLVVYRSLCLGCKQHRVLNLPNPN